MLTVYNRLYSSCLTVDDRFYWNCLIIDNGFYWNCLTVDNRFYWSCLTVDNRFYWSCLLPVASFHSKTHFKEDLTVYHFHISHNTWPFFQINCNAHFLPILFRYQSFILLAALSLKFIDNAFVKQVKRDTCIWLACPKRPYKTGDKQVGFDQLLQWTYLIHQSHWSQILH